MNFKVLFILLITSQFVYSQAKIPTPDIPTNYTLKEKEDYAPYQEKVLEIINWLEKIPISEENKAIRKPAEKFVMVWLMGSPTIHPPVHMAIIQPVMEETQRYGGVLMGRCLFGEAKALMKAEGKLESADIYLSGIESMIAAYDKISPKTKLKSMEKYKKLQQKEKLRKWIVKNVKMEKH